MQKLTFRPDDILFFKDGRPMMGASSGKGDQFPMPHVLHSALLAALHRSGEGIGHSHTLKDKNHQTISNSEKKFGALTNAGPFPVEITKHGERWYFPTPADLLESNTKVSLAPLPTRLGASSLPDGLHPLVSNIKASKEKADPWMSQSAWEQYLKHEETENGFQKDSDFFSTENAVGIGMNPETGTTSEGKIYTASRLRLKEDVRLGTFAELPFSHQEKDKPDELERFFESTDRVILGGERRTTAVTNQTIRTEALSLPMGPKIKGTRVKFVLLTPAIFPHLEATGEKQNENPGGWLPNWIEAKGNDYEVCLKPIIERNGMSRKEWREKVKQADPIRAKLVAAITPRPVVITGWSVENESNEKNQKGGAKSTLLAVPAGSIYYFETNTEAEAQQLADSLNWNGKGDGSKIMNRRSTLMGEKGYGLGVCTTWEPAG